MPSTRASPTRCGNDQNGSPGGSVARRTMPIYLGPAGTTTEHGRRAASGLAAGEKGIDDALFLGFYLVRAVELIVSARGFSRCTRHKDAPRFACAFNA